MSKLMTSDVAPKRRKFTGSSVKKLKLKSVLNDTRERMSDVRDLYKADIKELHEKEKVEYY
jgi:hypothetical protein